MPTIPEPDYNDPKEVYAFFGLAFYKANLIEQGLLNFVIALRAKKEQNVELINIKEIYNSFDTFTLGQIIIAAKKYFKFSDDFTNDLRVALKHRNYLAHHFFESHGQDLPNELGKRKMIEELVEILKFLSEVDLEMDKMWKNAFNSLGFTQEWLDSQKENYLK